MNAILKYLNPLETEAGRYLGVSYRMMLRYERQGLIAFGERGRIHRDDPDRFMVNHRLGRPRDLSLNTKQGVL